MNNDFLIAIETIELKYLKKFYYFLKFAEDEMFYGFNTKEEIKQDWIDKYSSVISGFSTGAERIVYALLNGKGIGQPNSSPVGSDLFFEVEDAYIHIDLKTVEIENIGDITNSIFVGNNQNSYHGFILVGKKKDKREYVPSLPTFYTKKDGTKKICLTYFITILYDKKTLEIELITINCMPNGELESYYKERVLCAGKTPSEARFRLNDVNKFELLEKYPSRIKVIYFNSNMNASLKKRLTLYEQLYNNDQV